MKEVNFKYFLNGEEVKKESIYWERAMSVIHKYGDEIHITYMSRPSHEYYSIHVDKEAQNEFDKIIEGVKHNKHKAPLDILQVRQFPKALQMLALATAYGHEKYKETDKDFLNFKRVKGGSQTYFDAAARHNAERYEFDDESNLPHMLHAVWDMLAALEMYIEENGTDVKEFSKEYLEYLHRSK